MKSYRTWEAIKMLTENKKLRFISENSCVLERTIDVPSCTGELYLNSTWRLIPQPVTFIEAVNSNRRFKPTNWTDYHTFRDMMHDLGLLSNKEYIDTLSGKWLIEEREGI